MSVKLHPFLAKLWLRFNPFRKVLVVVKGSNEDFDYFAELIWKDDKYLDFFDRDIYPQFQPCIYI
jgi:hypothetical protein